MQVKTSPSQRWLAKRVEEDDESNGGSGYDDGGGGGEEHTNANTATSDATDTGRQDRRRAAR